MSVQTPNLKNVEEDDASNRSEGSDPERVGARPGQLWEPQWVLPGEEGAETIGHREWDDEKM